MNKFDKLVDLLDQGGAKVSFRKLDGSTRNMTCTWGEDGDIFTNRVVVWDVENRGYRSIRSDAILTVS